MGAVFAFGAGTGDFTNTTPGAIAIGMRLTFLLGGGLMIMAIPIAFWRRPGLMPQDHLKEILGNQMLPDD